MPKYATELLLHSLPKNYLKKVAAQKILFFKFTAKSNYFYCSNNLLSKIFLNLELCLRLSDVNNLYFVTYHSKPVNPC